MKYGSGGDAFNSGFTGFKWDETRNGGDCLTAPPPSRMCCRYDPSLHYKRRLFLKGGIVDVNGKMSS